MKIENSKGKCIFCGEEYSKQGMTKHLAGHFAKEETNLKKGKSFHVKVETSKKWGKTPYFLHLWVDGNTTFKKIDSFLRAIWLECCGHMSAFRIPSNASHSGAFAVMDAYEYLDAGNEDKYNEIMDRETGQIPMKEQLKNVAYKELAIEYEYDFGSSTELTIAIVNEYPFTGLQPIILLSRNEALKTPCSACGKNTAKEICTVCSWDEEANFCEKCAKKHAKTCADFEDCALPIVNSPRCGVCDYMGGEIDVERD